MQVLSPRQQVLVPRKVVLVLRQAGSLNWEGAQAVQVLSPRQAGLPPRQVVLVPQLGRSTGSAGTHSQAGSINPPREECRQCKYSFPGRQQTAQE